jgi:hypothetical protein
MTITWDSFPPPHITNAAFRLFCFEKVWEIVDGQVRYRKFAPRMPATVSKWELDPNGGLSKIEQTAYINDTYKTIPIESDKLLVFTNEKEGSIFEGTSILRTEY